MSVEKRAASATYRDRLGWIEARPDLNASQKLALRLMAAMEARAIEDGEDPGDWLLAATALAGPAPVVESPEAAMARLGAKLAELGGMYAAGDLTPREWARARGTLYALMGSARAKIRLAARGAQTNGTAEAMRSSAVQSSEVPA